MHIRLWGAKFQNEISKTVMSIYFNNMFITNAWLCLKVKERKKEKDRAGIGLFCLAAGEIKISAQQEVL